MVRTTECIPSHAATSACDALCECADVLGVPAAVRHLERELHGRVVPRPVDVDERMLEKDLDVGLLRRLLQKHQVQLGALKRVDALRQRTTYLALCAVRLAIECDAPIAVRMDHACRHGHSLSKHPACHGLLVVAVVADDAQRRDTTDGQG